MKAVSRLLEDDGHVVSAFSEGREALDFIKSAPDVSVLMTSAELVSMSGLELCWEARLLSGRDRALYIILMSSNAEQSAVVNALDSGADEFIRKPPASEELYARLRTAERLLGQQREMIVLANLDSLTGAFNRRAFFEKTGDIAEAGRRFAAVMFDIDHFKDVNDNYGHDVGDRVLSVIGGETRKNKAIFGRLGGEEFAVVLEGSSLDAATLYAEGVRERLAALSFESAGQSFSVTASFGVAERAAQESIDLLLKRADAALYQAKRAGRNRVVAAPAEAGEHEAQWSNLLRGGKRGKVELVGAVGTGIPAKDHKRRRAVTYGPSRDRDGVATGGRARIRAGRRAADYGHDRKGFGSRWVRGADLHRGPGALGGTEERRARASRRRPFTRGVERGGDHPPAGSLRLRRQAAFDQRSR